MGSASGHNSMKHKSRKKLIASEPMSLKVGHHNLLFQFSAISIREYNIKKNLQIASGQTLFWGSNIHHFLHAIVTLYAANQANRNAVKIYHNKPMKYTK